MISWRLMMNLPCKTHRKQFKGKNEGFKIKYFQIMAYCCICCCTKVWEEQFLILHHMHTDTGPYEHHEESIHVRNVYAIYPKHFPRFWLVNCGFISSWYLMYSPYFIHSLHGCIVWTRQSFGCPSGCDLVFDGMGMTDLYQITTKESKMCIEIENNVCTRVTNCFSAHERVILVFSSWIAKQRWK